MAIPRNVNSKRIVSVFVYVMALLLLAPVVQAQMADVVKTHKDELGWKLKVNGEDFYVKGVVWGYSPRGENYSYNLWGQPKEFIKKVIDQEFPLLQAANINAIRAFSDIPPEWVTYIYRQYNIMTVVNPLFGRYGATINGVWVPNTNYQDPTTRETLKKEFVSVVRKYRNVPGVLMFALGNESNYGLSWSSFEIENLPEGEQNVSKARYLYSLFAEAIDAGKILDPNHPFTIVNGDIQYIDLIAEYGKNWDLIGINAYRGVSFEAVEGASLWEDVKTKLDKPVVFMEFGSDAFNAKEFVEDQQAQAQYLRGQWQEMYNKSYGQGEQGNALGGFVFQWRDEWWKYKQTENLDVHDRTASWENGGYKADHVPGQNNMNEEWFGITGLGTMNAEGIYSSEPRMAYYVLRDIWSLDPYTMPKAQINAAIGNVNMDLYSVKGEVERLRGQVKESNAFALTGGNFIGEMIVKGKENDISEDGENGYTFGDGQMLNLDFAFQPNNRLRGDFSINVLGNVADSDFEFRYGDRALPITVEVFDDDGAAATVTSRQTLKGRERVEIYDFQAFYEDEKFSLESFYHVPRFHWGYKGDFFGLLRETTDMEGQDIWNSKAPYGIEVTGKGRFKDVTILAGPEVYWGANPKAMLKYDFKALGSDLTFIHSEDIARRDDTASATEATNSQSRQTTLYAKKALGSGAMLEMGGLMASTEKVGDTYDRVDGGNIIVDEINSEDTLGFKAKLSFDVASSKAYVAVNYAGLVADSGDVLRENGTELPYSGLGNKKEIEGGILMTSGPMSIYPRFLIRENIVDANPSIDPTSVGGVLSPGVSPRNYDDDPFAVLDNREAKSAEVIFTYDPTPGSYFYDWNVDVIEDAPFAFNVGLTATEYGTDTDSDRFFFEEGNTNAAFGAGLSAEDIYLLKSKLIFNPSSRLKYIVDLSTGKQQTTGKPGEKAVEFASAEAKAIIDTKHIFSGYFKKDAFGPYDFYRQFNLTYPEQVKLEYTRLLGMGVDEKRSSKIGVKAFYRTLDEFSPEDEYQGGKNDYMVEFQTYFKYVF